MSRHAPRSLIPRPRPCRRSPRRIARLERPDSTAASPVSTGIRTASVARELGAGDRGARALGAAARRRSPRRRRAGGRAGSPPSASAAGARTSRLPRPASPANVRASAPAATPSREASATARVTSTARGPGPMPSPSAQPERDGVRARQCRRELDADRDPSTRRARSAGGALSRRRPSATTSSNADATTIDANSPSTRSRGERGAGERADLERRQPLRDHLGHALVAGRAPVPASDSSDPGAGRRRARRARGPRCGCRRATSPSSRARSRTLVEAHREHEEARLGGEPRAGPLWPRAARPAARFGQPRAVARGAGSRRRPRRRATTGRRGARRASTEPSAVPNGPAPTMPTVSPRLMRPPGSRAAESPVAESRREYARCGYDSSTAASCRRPATCRRDPRRPAACGTSKPADRRRRASRPRSDRRSRGARPPTPACPRSGRAAARARRSHRRPYVDLHWDGASRSKR